MEPSSRKADEAEDQEAAADAPDEVEAEKRKLEVEALRDQLEIRGRVYEHGSSRTGTKFRSTWRLQNTGRRDFQIAAARVDVLLTPAFRKHYQDTTGEEASESLFFQYPLDDLVGEPIAAGGEKDIPFNYNRALLDGDLARSGLRSVGFHPGWFRLRIFIDCSAGESTRQLTDTRDP